MKEGQNAEICLGFGTGRQKRFNRDVSDTERMMEIPAEWNDAFCGTICFTISINPEEVLRKSNSSSTCTVGVLMSGCLSYLFVSAAHRLIGYRIEAQSKHAAPLLGNHVIWSSL
ncbi:hypothetical protein LIER_15890 [Lithospermum erythrorhizon]|uniref:Uncharacterized protein n=1 Tax=Lithospermum erythrorhizon TaxID=34254 RepID=A0AAV3Q957_LITER